MTETSEKLRKWRIEGELARKVEAKEMARKGYRPVTYTLAEIRDHLKKRRPQ